MWIEIKIINIKISLINKYYVRASTNTRKSADLMAKSQELTAKLIKKLIGLLYTSIICNLVEEENGSKKHSKNFLWN